MTMPQIPARAARGTSAGGYSSTVDRASHPTAQHKTVASGRREGLIPAASNVSSPAEMAGHGCGNTPIWTSAPLAAPLKTARGKVP
jgi:hypothetical protein